MIDKKIFQLMLDKSNDTTINTQGVKIKGNYVFVRMNDVQTLLVAGTYNSYDLKQEQYIGMAEEFSQPTDYVESNNRTAWIKRYIFQAPITLRDKMAEMLQELYLYFKANNVQSIVDETTYKLVVKVNRPTLIGNQQQAGGISTMYALDFFAETIETGYYGNEATHKMKLAGTTTINAGSFIVGDTYKIKVVGTTDFTLIGASANTIGVIFTATGIGTGTGTADIDLQDIIVDQITISNGTTVDGSNILTSEVNAGHKPIARAEGYVFIIYYDSTTLVETILKIIEGKHTREQVIEYRKVFDGITHDYDLIISGGSVVYKNGVVVQLNFTAVEE